MDVQYKLTRVNGEEFLTAWDPEGVAHTARFDHPHWETLVEGVRANDPEVFDLFDVTVAVANKFQPLSERVSVADGHVYLDGDPMNNSLTQQIVRFLESGEDFMPLVRFYEKVEANPNSHSREHLYRWLAAEDFTITDDGDILGYKGCDQNGDGLQSTWGGGAWVDGERVEGFVPQKLGSVVTMPRSEVTFDPQHACSNGLHVGTWSYARGFGSVRIRVRVNPRDVVSVPVDSSDQKMRVCRYVVEEIVTEKMAAPVRYEEPWDLSEEEDMAAEEEEAAEDEIEDDDGVRVGQSFKDRDTRRGGRVGEVISVNLDNGTAELRWDNGAETRVSTARLRSRHYAQI